MLPDRRLLVLPIKRVPAVILFFLPYFFITKKMQENPMRKWPCICVCYKRDIIIFWTPLLYFMNEAEQLDKKSFIWKYPGSGL